MCVCVCVQARGIMGEDGQMNNILYALMCVPTFGRNSRVSRVWILSGVISCKSSVSAGELLHAQHGPGRGGRGKGGREGGREGGRARGINGGKGGG